MSLSKNTNIIKLIMLLINFIILFEIAVLFPYVNGKNEALIIDRFHDYLIDLPKEIPQHLTTGSWATACPLLNYERAGLVENALIVKQIYRKYTRASDVEIEICEEPYKLSLVYDVKKLSFKFGYAIYYELKNDGFFHRSDPQNFLTPVKATEFLQKNFAGATKDKVVRDKSFKKAKSTENEPARTNNEEIWLDEDERMEFTWIYLFKLRFDFSKKILITIQYSILNNNRWPMGEQCEEYKMGFELYEDIDVDKLYSKKHQAKIFENVKTPTVSTPSQYLSKWLLIPMDQFVFGSSGLPVCSNMATIPIWTDTVEKVLKRVDQYIFVLHHVLDGPVLVTSGISDDVLELPVSSRIGRAVRRKTAIYLYPDKKKVPVPKIIYKIVKYRSNNCISDPMCWMSAIIIIHNDPYYENNSKSKICDDIATSWGWNDILKDANGNKFTNIYVCENEVKVLTKLFGRNVTFGQRPIGVLRLINIPVYGKGEEVSTDYRSVKNDVYRKLQELDQNGMDSDLGRKVMVVRRQEDDDREIIPADEIKITK